MNRLSCTGSAPDVARPTLRSVRCVPPSGLRARRPRTWVMGAEERPTAQEVVSRAWANCHFARLQMAAASSTHPSPGGNHAKGNQEQPYSEYHIVFHARMIAFGHDAQPERGSKRADCACIPLSSFPYADGEYRTDGYAQERRDRSPAVHVCLLADRAVGIIMRLTHPGVDHCQRARRTGPVTCGRRPSRRDAERT
jgi:hypothetical protein